MSVTYEDILTLHTLHRHRNLSRSFGLPNGKQHVTKQAK